VLLKRERTLNGEERLNLDGWTKNYPALGEAYRLGNSDRYSSVASRRLAIASSTVSPCVVVPVSGFRAT